LAWVVAIGAWSLRRLAGRSTQPSHSMSARSAVARAERSEDRSLPRKARYALPKKARYALPRKARYALVTLAVKRISQTCSDLAPDIGRGPSLDGPVRSERSEDRSLPTKARLKPDTTNRF